MEIPTSQQEPETELVLLPAVFHGSLKCDCSRFTSGNCALLTARVSRPSTGQRGEFV